MNASEALLSVTRGQGWEGMPMSYNRKHIQHDGSEEPKTRHLHGTRERTCVDWVMKQPCQASLPFGNYAAAGGWRLWQEVQREAIKAGEG